MAGQPLILDPAHHTISMMMAGKGNNAGKWFYTYSPAPKKADGKENGFITFSECPEMHGAMGAVPSNMRNGMKKYTWPPGISPSTISHRVIWKPNTYIPPEQQYQNQPSQQQIPQQAQWTPQGFPNPNPQQQYQQPQQSQQPWLQQSQPTPYNPPAQWGQPQNSSPDRPSSPVQDPQTTENMNQLRVAIIQLTHELTLFKQSMASWNLQMKLTGENIIQGLQMCSPQDFPVGHENKKRNNNVIEPGFPPKRRKPIIKIEPIAVDDDATDENQEDGHDQDD